MRQALSRPSTAVSEYRDVSEVPRAPPCRRQACGRSRGEAVEKVICCAERDLVVVRLFEVVRDDFLVFGGAFLRQRDVLLENVGRVSPGIGEADCIPEREVQIAHDPSGCALYHATDRQRLAARGA